MTHRTGSLLLLLCLASPSVHAYGPGVHCREADRAIELLMEVDESWVADMETPYAKSYLRIGSNSPDFQWATDSLNFGHAKELSYHLLKSAETLGPEHRLFALGHLAHVAGDASAEVFVTPTVFASAPIGPMDLFIGNDKPKSESEAIVEGYGDLVNGDWEAVVETIWDLRLESPEAWDRFADIFLWYCETGNELFDNSDCGAALAQLDERFGTADDLLGGLDLDGAKNLVQALVNQPLETLFDLYSSGLLAFLLGQESTPSDNYDFYAAFFLAGPLVDPALWSIYENDFVDLGPVFTVDHYENEVLGWPEYDGVSLISGNIQSLLQFLPETYSAQPGLHVTELRWFNSGGAEINQVTAEMVGQTLTAQIRFFSALPFTGTVYAHVLGDAPGLNRAQDVWLAQGDVSVDIDPFAYSVEPQTILTIPFPVETTEVDGFYVELFTPESELPWFTSNSDAFWGIDELPMHLPAYQNYETYADFPRSLPVAGTSSNTGSLLLRVNIAPAGPSLPEATAVADGSEMVTHDGGTAIFPLLPAEVVDVAVSKTDYESAITTVPIAPGQPTWWSVHLHALPNPVVPPTLASSACIPVTWNSEPFADQLAEMFGRVIAGATSVTEWTPMGNEKEGELCPPNGEWTTETPLQVELRGTYTDGTFGVTAISSTISVDGTPPEIIDVLVTSEDLACESLAESFRPATVVRVRATDAESGIVAMELHWVENEETLPLELEPVAGGLQGVAKLDAAPADNPTFQITVENGAGIRTEETGTVTVVEPCPPDTSEESDKSGLEVPDGEGTDSRITSNTGEGVQLEANGSMDDDGCRSHSNPSTGWGIVGWLLVLALAREISRVRS